MINRRTFLVSAAMWFVGMTSLTGASTIRDHMPWSPVPSSADEAHAIEAIVDRIISPDPETPGGKNAGCAVFIDRQLKSRYGSAAGGLGPYTGAAVAVDAG